MRKALPLALVPVLLLALSCSVTEESPCPSGVEGVVPENSSGVVEGGGEVKGYVSAELLSVKVVCIPQPGDRCEMAATAIMQVSIPDETMFNKVRTALRHSPTQNVRNEYQVRQS